MAAPAAAVTNPTIRYCDGLWEEGEAAKRDTALARADDNIRFQRGEQWPRRLPPGVVDFTLNLVNDVIQRKAGLLTDARPSLQVISSNEEVNSRHGLLEALEKCVRAIWDQASWSEELARGIAMAEVIGAQVGMIGWDPRADGGRGDIRPRFFDPRYFVYDPAVVAAVDLQEGEFCGTREVRTLPSLVEQYGQRAFRVKPDTTLSSFARSTSQRAPSGVLSPNTAGRQFRHRPQSRITSQIPRADHYNMYFKDFQRNPENGQPIFYQDGKPARRVIRHVAYAGGVVLTDESNQAWHGEFPYEIYDWGLELDNPMGQSEVHNLRRVQEVLNKIVSQMIKNTILTNNIKVVGDSNALDAEQWDRLTNRPAMIVRKRPNTNLDFVPPPSLPGYLFQVVQLLMRAIDLVSGMGEVTRGAASPSQSGVAIESLSVASQTLIRYQARRMESFTVRLWRKAIPLIFQHYGHKRVLRLVGSGNRIETYVWDRSALFGDVIKPEEIFQDLILNIAAGSSLAVARIQKATLAIQLRQLGLLRGVEVLRATDWPDAERVYEEAQREMAENPPPQPSRRGGGRGGSQGRQRTPAGFPAGGPVAVNGR